jgi:uncharacterized FAD-dependent dehydrogenase
MQKELQIKCPVDRIDDQDFIKNELLKKLSLTKNASLNFKLIKKSIDSRKYPPVFILSYAVNKKERVITDSEKLSFNYGVSKTGKKVAIIGAGPAGYFAALECLEYGLTPIVVERGKDVRARRRDLRAIQQEGIVNPHSNYCFGEGGAGTYSDGKLYTRSKKRGKIIKTLRILVDHGAKEDILTDAHPHIGSNKLPGIISNIRNTIESNGGRVMFDSHVTDFEFDGGSCRALIINNESRMEADHYILATGHSARDIFALLDKHDILLEAKPYALGVRIEHPQELIDEIQYGQNPRHPNLPASSYSLVCQIGGKGVFSFCMCPGGLIVPAATAPGEIVVNGMSLSRRDSKFANSGLVTELSTEELNAKGYMGKFGNLAFQQEVEQSLFQNGDGSQKAPAQNLIDFINGKMMLELNESSYIPGLYKAPLHELLPDYVYTRLRDGLLNFSMRLKGFHTDAAHVVATESRTSSPVRIPRDKMTCLHPQLNNFYPCGEGAGYAGGILSAAMDGQRVVKCIASQYHHQ